MIVLAAAIFVFVFVCLMVGVFIGFVLKFGAWLLSK